jgi:hypothetical protein
MKIEVGQWYWLSGRGPMRYEGETKYTTFCGYTYWAHPDMVQAPVDASGLERHTEELFRVFPIHTWHKITPTSVKWLATCRKESIGEAVDFIQETILNGHVGDRAILFNILIPDIYPLQRYGTMCPVKRLLREIRDHPTVIHDPPPPEVREPLSKLLDRLLKEKTHGDSR